MKFSAKLDLDALRAAAKTQIDTGTNLKLHEAASLSAVHAAKATLAQKHLDGDPAHALLVYEAATRGVTTEVLAQTIVGKSMSATSQVVGLEERRQKLLRQLQDAKSQQEIDAIVKASKEA